MIRLIDNGSYLLGETGDAPRILILDSCGGKRTYAWELANGIQIRLIDRKPDESYSTLAAGKYRKYQVRDEPGLTNGMHLELLVGEGMWQGYLLPKGLPSDLKTKTVIPAQEIITKSFAGAHFPIR